MGYSLECYALSHHALQALIGSGRDELVRTLVDAEARLFVSRPDVPWQAALRELLTGERGRMLARNGPTGPGSPEPASAEEAAAMTALVRAGGRRVGELIHNSRAGEKFRAVFHPASAPAQFAQPELAAYMLGRPLAFLVGEGYPRWGGLTNAELTSLLGGRSSLRQPPSDPDQHEWLHALFNVLADVHGRGEDLVTLYL